MELVNEPAQLAEKPSTSSPERIIDTAERLIGELGIEGVSLRRISMAAGQRNNYAVQYHFGDIDGLIRAIHECRIPEIEFERSRMLARTEAEGRLGDARTLMGVLYLPLIEHRSRTGERAHARFVLAMHSTPQGLRLVHRVGERMPVAAHVLELMRQLHPHLSKALILERQRLISVMVLNAIFNRRAPFDVADGADQALIENVLDMATAALLAPVSARVDAILQDNI